jgi:aspergillopepsin I
VEPQKASTFFDNAQPSLDSPLFAAYLPKNANGSYDFGAFDSSKFTGSLVYTDVDDTNGFWEYPSTSFIVSTADGSLSDSMNNFTGITDTGTTLILMADVAVNAYYDQVSGATYSEGYGGYVFDCSTSLPDLSVQIGDEYATVPGSFLNFAPVSQDGPCFGGIQSVGNGTMNIYGGVFLNAFYSVFDDSGATPSFGYAPSTGPTS